MLKTTAPLLQADYAHLRDLAAENNWLADASADPFSGAFPKKRAVHAGMSGSPVAEADKQALLEKLRNTPRTGPSAAYVHLPYCESKCLYCGFFGGKYTEKSGATYLTALLKEIEADAAYPSTQKSPIHALYLGGGTPTALQAHELRLLLTTLRECLPLANDCEITVEGRIHNFGAEKMEACLEAGANRFSLGVQTFNTERRRMLGRFAAKKDVIAHLTRLASYDQAAVVIDLIYGLPGQTVADWQDDIKTFLDLPLHGVDLYQLNVFPGSGLSQAIASGKVPATAQPHEQSNYFRAGIERMQQARFNRLSISHWGRTTRERNMYNPLAKTRANCLHFGSGAGGALHGWFMANESNPDAYREHCMRGNKPVTMVVAPPKELAAVRTILEHMEHCRLNLNALSNAYEDKDIPPAAILFAPLLDSWEQAGLITRSESWMELTLAGQFWQGNLTQALLGWQNLLFQELHNVETH